MPASARPRPPALPPLPEHVEALFGGSFDPVHVGHLVVAEAAAEQLGLTVRFLPAREQPFKATGHEASPPERAAMLDLAVAGNPRFRVERIELDLPAPSYTVPTLRALAAREPGNRFVLLLGADAARELPEWFEVEALPGLADVVAFARAGAEPVRHPLVRRTVAVPALEVSATDIRARVRAGRSIRYLVPEAVRAYISERGLYR